MLKSVLYYLLLLTTTVRFADIVYLLMKDSTNLPGVVLVVTTAMVVYGMVLSVRKFIGTVRIKQLMNFYMVQTAMIAFNLVYMAATCPLQITAAETLIVGTFLDLLVNSGIIFLCFRQVRGGRMVAVQQRYN